MLWSFNDLFYRCFWEASFVWFVGVLLEWEFFIFTEWTNPNWCFLLEFHMVSPSLVLKNLRFGRVSTRFFFFFRSFVWRTSLRLGRLRTCVVALQSSQLVGVGYHSRFDTSSAPFFKGEGSGATGSGGCFRDSFWGSTVFFFFLCDYNDCTGNYNVSTYVCVCVCVCWGSFLGQSKYRCITCGYVSEAQ